MGVGRRQAASFAVVAVVAVGAALATALTAPAGRAGAAPASDFSLVSGAPFATGPMNPETMAFGPDGNLIATTDDPSTTLTIMAEGTGGSWGVASSVRTGLDAAGVAYSPDGTLVATADTDDGNVKVYPVSSTGLLGSGTATSVGPSGSLTYLPTAVAFNPSGGLLATANFDPSSVTVFSVGFVTGSLTPLETVATATQPTALAFSPDGGLLAVTSSASDAVSLYSVSPVGDLTQTAGSPAPAGSDPVSPAFSPDGTELAVADQGGNAIDLLSVSPSGFNCTNATDLTEPCTTTGSSVASGQIATAAAPTSIGFSPYDPVFGSELAVAEPNLPGTEVFVEQLVEGAGVNQVEAGALPGSPIAAPTEGIGLRPDAVAFSPIGDLLATANLGYSVGGSIMTYTSPLQVEITAPANGATYALGSTVDAAYSCGPTVDGPPIESCQGPVEVGAPVGMTNAGTYTFDVTAIDGAAEQSTASVTYTVAKAPTRITHMTRGAQVKPNLAGFVGATLTRKDTGAPVAGEVIRFTAGTTTLCRAVTDNLGAATCRYPGLDAIDIILNNGDKATFQGDGNYLSSSATSPFLG